jgi:hypothetical protein
MIKFYKTMLLTLIALMFGICATYAAVELPLKINNDTTFKGMSDSSGWLSTYALKNPGSNKAIAFKAVLATSTAPISHVAFFGEKNLLTGEDIKNGRNIAANTFSTDLLSFWIHNNTRDGFLIAFQPQKASVSTNVSGLVNNTGGTVSVDLTPDNTEDALASIPNGDAFPEGANGVLYADIETPYVLKLSNPAESANGVVPIPYEILFSSHPGNAGSGASDEIAAENAGQASELVTKFPTEQVSVDNATRDCIRLPGSVEEGLIPTVEITQNSNKEEFTVLYSTPEGLTEPMTTTFVMRMTIKSANTFNFAGSYQTTNKIAFIDI